MPAFAGTAEPGAIITILDGAAVLGSVVTDAAGTWSFTPATPLGEGPHAITLTATDAAGNTGSGLRPARVQRRYRPARRSRAGDHQRRYRHRHRGDPRRRHHRRHQPAFAGTAEPGAIVTILDGAAVLGSVVTDAAGTWSFTPATPLSEGPHSITLTATDAAGNTGPASAPLAFSVDTGLPAAPVLATISDDIGTVTGAISGGDTTDDTMPAFAGTAEPGAIVTILDGAAVLGSVVTDAAGTWSFTPAAPLSEGPHAITLTATDAAGNTGPASAPLAFSVDTGLPAAPVLAAISDDIGTVTGAILGGDTTDDTMPAFAGTAEPGAIVTILDGAAVLGSVVTDAAGTWSFTPATPLGEGPHSITLTATDAAGNTGPASGPARVQRRYRPARRSRAQRHQRRYRHRHRADQRRRHNRRHDPDLRRNRRAGRHHHHPRRRRQSLGTRDHRRRRHLELHPGNAAR